MTSSAVPTRTRLLLFALLAHAAQGGVVRLAGLYPLNGSSLSVSVQLSKAAQLAVATVNANGTLLPSDTLALIQYDTGVLSADAAVPAYSAYQVVSAEAPHLRNSRCPWAADVLWCYCPESVHAGVR